MADFDLTEGVVSSSREIIDAGHSRCGKLVLAYIAAVYLCSIGIQFLSTPAFWEGVVLGFVGGTFWLLLTLLPVALLGPESSDALQSREWSRIPSCAIFIPR